jgi:hypothetical protein
VIAGLLAVALLIGGGGLPLLARGPDALYVYYIQVRPRPFPKTVFIGERRELLARVMVAGVDASFMQVGAGVSGHRLTGMSSDPAIAKLQPKAAPTPYEGERGALYQGEYFDLIGAKPGRVTLTFRATIPAFTDKDPTHYETYGITYPGQKVTETITVEVKKCDYVNAVHTWPAPGGAATATMAEVMVTADDQGRLSGTGVLEWVASYRFGNCWTMREVEPSGVDITGAVGDDGLLGLRFSFERSLVKGSVTCPQARGYVGFRGRGPIKPADVSLALPADGGTTQFAQGITAVGLGGGGTIVVTVEPVRDDAIASAGTRVVRAGGSGPLAMAVPAPGLGVAPGSAAELPDQTAAAQPRGLGGSFGESGSDRAR